MKRLEARHSSPECLPSLGYLASPCTPMIICGRTPAVPSFLWTSGFPFPQLASSLQAQHRYHLSPRDCTSAACKQTSIHSPDIFHRHHSQGPLIPHPWRIILQHPISLSLLHPHPQTSSTHLHFCSRVPSLPVLLFPSGPEFLYTIIFCNNKPHLSDSSSPESLSACGSEISPTVLRKGHEKFISYLQ
ncbi:hypothetical protein ILYODFUR_017715 [Ilyodon furcidens]|uniref:Uncharacterized protein n=1 Tax=Ilyodon furcidens TaxID=33524 RepID=A0ABV0UAD8_9TELE